MALRDNYNNLNAFNQSNRRIKEKEQQIKDLENELNLLKEQAVSIYKGGVYYALPDQATIDSAKRWLCVLQSDELDTDYDSNTPDMSDDEVIYGTLNMLISDIIGYDISVSNIIEYNFGQAVIFEFDYEGYEWQLEIPFVPFISMRDFNYENDECFKLKINLKKSPTYIERVGSTFLEEDLKDIISKKLQMLEVYEGD